MLSIKKTASLTFLKSLLTARLLKSEPVIEAQPEQQIQMDALGTFFFQKEFKESKKNEKQQQNLKEVEKLCS